MIFKVRPLIIEQVRLENGKIDKNGALFEVIWFNTGDYETTFTTMGTMYNKYKTIIENATGAYNKVLELKLTEESLASTNGIIKTLLSSLADTIIGEMQRNQKNYANTPLFESTIKAFQYYNTIIESATKTYKKYLKQIINNTNT